MGAQIHMSGCDDLFPNGVDGRIGDLSKHLLEILKEKGVTLAQNRERGIVSHRAHGIVARKGHR